MGFKAQYGVLRAEDTEASGVDKAAFAISNPRWLRLFSGRLVNPEDGHRSPLIGHRG